MRGLPPGFLLLQQLFTQPPAAFRGKPFWSWNAKLEKSELLRQIDIFAEMGMGGFFMHSRTGLETEYLGPEWFTLINECADYAHARGLEAWLYDEDRWPSGSAGGLATLDPRFRLKSLRLQILPAAQFRWEDLQSSVAIFEAELTGLETHHLRQLAPLEIPQRSQVLVFSSETTRPHSFYNGCTYLDTLQKEATEHFLKITHERYREHCGDRLGRSIRGIFTDEAHHGMVMCHQTETRQEEDPQWTAPFTDRLFSEFAERFGYRLEPRLPELFLWVDGGKISQVKWHYMELLQTLFLENWAKPIQQWCQRHNLILTGHGLHEDSLTAQAVPCGSLIRYYEFLDYPGVDVLGLDNQNFWIVKQLASAARQLGKPWMLSELYGCTGWQLDFSGHKGIGTWQALYGINLRCHHLAWYSMSGEAKRDYPASIFFQSAWHQAYHRLEDYFSRLHVLLQRGKPVCDILVLNPIETLWAQIHAGWATWLQSNCPRLSQIEIQYQNLFTWVTQTHLDFDYGDEDFLQRFGRIESELDQPPRLRIAQSCYKVVVVAGMETIRSSSLDLLQKFAAAGGTVLFVGPPPTHLDALPSPLPQMLAEQTHALPFTQCSVALHLQQVCRPRIRLSTPQSASTRDLHCQIRREDDLWILVILNTSQTDSHLAVQIEADLPGFVEEWDCASGERFQQPTRSELQTQSWPTDFAPLAERVFLIGTPRDSSLSVRLQPSQTNSMALPGPFDFELTEPNLCVLDFASFQLADGPWQSKLEILQLDQCLRAELQLPQRSGVMIQPWAANASPPESPARDATPLRLRFEFQVQVLPSTPVELMLETPTRFSILVNDSPVKIPDQPGWLIDPCLKRIPIPALRLGSNWVELQTEFSADLNLEPIYLLGQFAVQLNGTEPILSELPSQLHPSDVTLQGLPFYSGGIRYSLPIPELPDSAWLETGPFGGAVITLGAETTIAWPPYRTPLKGALLSDHCLLCEVWLTRRNTFGPLHLFPLSQSHIGPNSFRSSGSAFTSDYQLYPSGLLSAPILHRSALKTSDTHAGQTHSLLPSF